MELAPEGPGELRLTLVNGEERRDAGLVQRDGDAISVEIPPYRSRLVARVTDGGEGLEGRWDRDRGAGHEELLAFAAVAGPVPDRGDLLSPEDADALTRDAGYENMVRSQFEALRAKSCGRTRALELLPALFAKAKVRTEASSSACAQGREGDGERSCCGRRELREQ